MATDDNREVALTVDQLTVFVADRFHTLIFLLLSFLYESD